MADSLENIFIILINSEFIIGILGNGFITLVNCIDWIKMQKIALADRILTALAISRIGLILVMMVSWFTNESYPFSSLDIRRNKIILFSISGLLATHFSVCLATGLSPFYFLKIANFLNAIFLHLKFRIEMVVMVIFLGTLVLLPLSLTLVSIYINIKIHAYERNMTLNSKNSDTETFSKLIIFTSGIFLTFYYIPELFSPINVLPAETYQEDEEPCNRVQGSQLQSPRQSHDHGDIFSHTTCQSLPVSSHNNF